MHKHVLVVSFAALCASVSAAGAMPVAPAPAGAAIVEPVTYYGYGYRHHGYHYGYRHHYYGYRHYGYRHYGYRHHGYGSW